MTLNQAVVTMLDRAKLACHTQFMTCALRTAFAAVLFLVLFAGIGGTAAAAQKALPGGQFTVATAEGPTVDLDGHGGHGQHDGVVACSVSALHCSSSIILGGITCFVAQPRRIVGLPPEGRLLAGWLHEAQTPPP